MSGCSAQSSLRKAVLDALEAAQELNREAGASSEVLEAITTAAVRGTYFDKFCSELTASIKTCFSHFGRVRPHLAKVRAHQEFHKLRLVTLPDIWNLLTTKLGQPQLEPLQHQAVNRIMFDSLMKEHITLHLPQATAGAAPEKKTLLADEQNAIRYASGYVVMKLSKKLAHRSGKKEAQFKECLSSMANSCCNDSFYQYTLEWMSSVDRGGLFYINDNTFILFSSIELKTQQLLPNSLSGPTQIHAIKKTIAEDEDINRYWSIISIDISSEEDSAELLDMLVDMWVTMRGFAITSSWMEEYKRAAAKTVKKSKGLRKQLQDSED